MAFADIKFLVGRHFAAKSNNVCVMQAIGDYGLRANWKNKPTDQDIKDFDEWFMGVCGDLEVTLFEGGNDRKAELEAYQKFLNENA